MGQGFLKSGQAGVAAAQLLLPARANRRAVVLFSPDGTTKSYTVGDSPDVVDGVGVFMRSNGSPVTLDRALLGELVQGALYVVASETLSFGYIEVLD